MGFRVAILALVAGGFLFGASAAGADAPQSEPAGARVLVLPLKALGVSEATEAVFQELLSGELENRGLSVVSAGAGGASDRCDEARCAAAAMREAGAGRVVYGSMSRLGEKVVVRLHALKAGEENPSFSDLVTALSEEDLDTVARRFADGIASGRSSADRANVDTITREEAETPARRAARRGIGFRAGFLFPVGDSYAGADRLTSLRLAYKYETRKFFIETTPALGLAWGHDDIDWTVLDIFAAKILGLGDYSPYVGGGLGVHSVRLEKKVLVRGDGFSYEQPIDQSETTLSFDAGVGLLAMRTYSLEIVVDLRWHQVLAGFDKVGGKGAHGIMLTFGTSG